MLTLELTGKHAVITGGGGGIGGATAVEMARLGAEVTVVDREISLAQAVAAQITEEGGIAHSVELDVADTLAVRRAFASLARPCDILVNGAGVIKYASLLEQDEASLNDLLAINLRGTFVCLQEGARQMIATGEGAIVNLSSVAAYVAARLPAAGYAMTKAGIRHLTTVASTELAGKGVRVNAVAPATIDTPFVKGTLDTPEQRAAAAGRSPMGRIGQPIDVVGAIVFLASPLASFITGHTLVIDGGRTGRSA